jgi:hypothetical protein
VSYLRVFKVNVRTHNSKFNELYFDSRQWQQFYFLFTASKSSPGTTHTPSYPTGTISPEVKWLAHEVSSSLPYSAEVESECHKNSTSHTPSYGAWGQLHVYFMHNFNPSGFTADFKFIESAFGFRPCIGKLSRRFGNRNVSGNVEKSFPKVHSALYVHVVSPPVRFIYSTRLNLVHFIILIVWLIFFIFCWSPLHKNKFTHKSPDCILQPANVQTGHRKIQPAVPNVMKVRRYLCPNNTNERRYRCFLK